MTICSSSGEQRSRENSPSRGNDLCHLNELPDDSEQASKDYNLYRTQGWRGGEFIENGACTASWQLCATTGRPGPMYLHAIKKPQPLRLEPVANMLAIFGNDDGNAVNCK
jgi:hypothetical protein